MNIALKFIIALSFLLTNVICHDLCLDGTFPGDAGKKSAKFKCIEYKQKSCCGLDEDRAVWKSCTSSIAEHFISNECKYLIRKVFCQKCSPKSAHLYEGDSNIPREFPNLCRDFCVKLYSKCGNSTNLIFGGQVCNPLAEDKTEHCYPNTDTFDKKSSKLSVADDPDCIPVCLQKITDRVKNLVDSAYPPNSKGRLFVLQQDGLIYEFEDGKKLNKIFLNFRDKLYQPTGLDERGLLSMVFHPDFDKNKYFYLSYTPRGNGIALHVIRLTVSDVGPPMKFDPKSEIIILKISKPAPSHNGGQLFFGNDGYLYITTGDGGRQYDAHGAHGNGQLLTTLLGKVLRIDINTAKGYKIPNSNPFVNSKKGEKKEIYAYGFRNPWRASIDRTTDRIFLGDVGQGHVEEVNIVEKGGNYGWRAYEGDTCFDKQMCKSLSKIGKEPIKPIHSYEHKGKMAAVIGGYVYRGSSITKLIGRYLFGENKGGHIWALEERNDKWSRRHICIEESACPAGTESASYWNRLFGFGVDENDEIYIFVGNTSDVNTANGAMYKLVQPLGQH